MREAKYTMVKRNIKRHQLGNKKHGGWVPDKPKNDKDLRIDALLGAATLKLPENPSLSPSLFPMQKDQKNLGSCTGESVAYGGEYVVIEKANIEGQDVTSAWWKKWGLSGLAGYYFAREIEHSINEDSGAEIRDAIDGMRRNGLPTEASWPYVISKFMQRPSAAAMKTAPWHKLDGLKTYVCDDPGGSREVTLTNILRALEKGMPVNFGFSCPADWGDYDNTGKIPLPRGSYDNGHAMTSLRADTRNRFLEGPNTWGDQIGGPQPTGIRVPSRGGRGWFALPFEYVLSGDATDAWAMSL